MPNPRHDLRVPEVHSELLRPILPLFDIMFGCFTSFQEVRYWCSHSLVEIINPLSRLALANLSPSYWQDVLQECYWPWRLNTANMLDTIFQVLDAHSELLRQRFPLFDMILSRFTSFQEPRFWRQSHRDHMQVAWLWLSIPDLKKNTSFAGL